MSKKIISLVLIVVFLFSIVSFYGAGKKLTVAMIPKLKGIDYFNACENGAKEAAKELGIDLIYDGPIEGRVDQQIEMIDNWIAQKVDFICVSPNDPNAIAPVLKKAMKAGIKVGSWDADAAKDARNYFINQATYEAIGFMLVDKMVEETGADAPVAIVTAGLTDANQNAWIDAMKKRMSSKYPKLKLLKIVPSETSQELAFKVTTDLIKTYPEMKGVWGISSMAFPGCAEAVKQAGKSGKIAVGGLSTPSGMRSFVKDGTVKSVTLWNPVDLGYLTMYAVKAIADGKGKITTSTIKAGKLGEKKVVKDEVLLGDPYVFNAGNIDQFTF
jgi:rhamnose transport system substrate-binding protein